VATQGPAVARRKTVNGNIIHGNAIPSATPPHHLVYLLSCYTDPAHPETPALPREYVDAITQRIATLLQGDDEAAA
jgi:hypothetical protein